MADVELMDNKEARVARRRLLTLEVLALSGSSILTVIFGFVYPPKGTDPFLTGLSSHLFPWVVTSMVRGIPALCLYLFVMYVSGDPFTHFGLRPIRWPKDAVPAAVALIGSAAVYGFYHFFAPHAPRDPATESYYVGKFAPFWVLAAASLFIGVSYEVIFRGYLIPRLEELSGSAAIAVIGQAVFYGLIHLDYGWPHVIVSTALGLVLGMVFVKWRTLWPLVLAHAVVDFGLTYLVVTSVGKSLNV